MSDRPPRFLFVPVSGPTGMGEYARCLTLAEGVRQRWLDAAVHFLLSEQAPYARATPFEHTLFPGSPTLHDEAGREAIRRFAPDVAVFDNSGRRGQLAAAAASGRVVYVSSRWRPRSKAFRLRWMRFLAEHWIPYPEFAGGALTRFERFKLRTFGGPRVRFLDVVLPAPTAPAAAATLARHGVEADAFVLVVPGGGSAHRGADDAPRVYAEVATRLAATGRTVVVVGRDAPPAAAAAGADAAAAPRWAGRVPPAELAALLAAARLVVTNGGDTLLQSLAFGRPTVAAPIALDQPQRLERCAARGGVVPVPLEADALAGAALGLLGDPAALERLRAVAGAVGLRNGLEVALDAFAALLAARTA